MAEIPHLSFLWKILISIGRLCNWLAKDFAKHWGCEIKFIILQVVQHFWSDDPYWPILLISSTGRGRKGSSPEMFLPSNGGQQKLLTDKNWQTTSSIRENTSYKKPYIWYWGTLMFKLRIDHICWEIHSKLMVFPKKRLHVKVLWLTRKTFMGTTVLSTIKKIGDNCFLQKYVIKRTKQAKLFGFVLINKKERKAKRFQQRL